PGLTFRSSGARRNPFGVECSIYISSLRDEEICIPTGRQSLKVPIAADVSLGKDVRIFQPELVNLYGCAIGPETKIGAFVEIQKNAKVGARCKISSHSFID